MYGLIRRREDPFSIFDNLINSTLGGYDSFALDNSPAVNIIKKESSYDLKIAAPGFSRDDFDVNIEDGQLTISAAFEYQNNVNQDHFYFSLNIILTNLNPD